MTFKKLYITVVFERIYHFCILFLGCSLAVLDSFVTLIVFLITIYACEILVSIQLNENFSSREKCVSSQTVLFFRCFRFFFFPAKTRVLNQLELHALMFTMFWLKIVKYFLDRKYRTTVQNFHIPKHHEDLDGLHSSER